jgi:hypothetical protein
MATPAKSGRICCVNSQYNAVSYEYSERVLDV